MLHAKKLDVRTGLRYCQNHQSAVMPAIVTHDSRSETSGDMQLALKVLACGTDGPRLVEGQSKVQSTVQSRVDFRNVPVVELCGCSSIYRFARS
jgi:hypothetical protein